MLALTGIAQRNEGQSAPEQRRIFCGAHAKFLDRADDQCEEPKNPKTHEIQNVLSQ
jgi:hypothetical protein